MIIVLLVVGVWLMLDGVGSILVYWHQSILEHAVRCIRFVCGAIVTLAGALL